MNLFREHNRAELQAVSSAPEDRHLLDRLPAGENSDGFEIQLRELPARTVAYIRVVDPFVGRRVIEAAEDLIAWAEARGLADGQWLGYMWDDPEVVALGDCRYDVGVEVERAGPSGRVGVGSISSCGHRAGCSAPGCRGAAMYLPTSRTSKLGSADRLPRARSTSICSCSYR